MHAALAAAAVLAALASASRTLELPQRFGGAVRTWSGSAEPLSPGDAARIARWVGVVFDGAQAHWSRALRTEMREPYRPGELKLFTLATATPCGGAKGAVGPFYCARDRIVAFDLRFLNAVERMLGADAASGVATVVGQTVAVNAQHAVGTPGIFARAQGAASPAGELALALQADCLTGVWARRIAGQLPGIDAELYGRVVAVERAVARRMGRAPQLPQVTYDVIGPGELAARQSAFATGLRAGRQSACPPPLVK